MTKYTLIIPIRQKKRIGLDKWITAAILVLIWAIGFFRFVY